MSETPVVTKSTGVINPPFHGAFFEDAHGNFFDAKKRLMGKDENGLPVPVKEEAPPPATEASPKPVDPDMLTASQLLRQQNMPIGKWKAYARKLIGPEAPGSKALLIPILNEIAQNEPADMPDVPQPSTPVEAGPDEEVDLVAWGTGKKNYLMGKVFKAIRDKYNADVGSQFAAVDFLINEKVITEAQARKVA